MGDIFIRQAQGPKSVLEFVTLQLGVDVSLEGLRTEPAGAGAGAGRAETLGPWGGRATREPGERRGPVQAAGKGSVASDTHPRGLCGAGRTAQARAAVVSRRFELLLTRPQAAGSGSRFHPGFSSGTHSAPLPTCPPVTFRALAATRGSHPSPR